jgi:antitoxin component YwqK of YwqJK toxin-antitoxin module
LTACGGEAPACPSGTELEGRVPTAKLLKELKKEQKMPREFEAVCVIQRPRGTLRHGEYRRWYGDGVTLRESVIYEGGVKHGPYTYYHPNGQVLEQGTHQYGLRQGRFTTFHKNGGLHVEGEYVDNKRSGDFVVTSDNGMNIQKGTYFMGHKHGKWVSKYIPLRGETLQVKYFYHYGVVVNEP